MVKKKEVHHALVVRQKNAFRRKDGSYVRFDENAVVLLDKAKHEPLGEESSGRFQERFKKKDITR